MRYSMGLSKKSASILDLKNMQYVKLLYRIIFRVVYTHTHDLTALFPGLPRWAGTRKVGPIWILLKQETVSGSGISWARCKSAPHSRQITMPAPHSSVFLQAGCPSCRPTNSAKALKEWIRSNCCDITHKPRLCSLQIWWHIQLHRQD